MINIIQQVMKAETEEKQQQWEQTQSYLNCSVSLIDIVQEDQKRNYCTSLDLCWISLNQTMVLIEKALLRQIRVSDVPLEDRIACIECSLTRIQSNVSQLHSPFNNSDQVTVRRKELQVPTFLIEILFQFKIFVVILQNSKKIAK